MEILFFLFATIVLSGLIYLLYKNSLYAKRKEAEEIQDKIVAQLQGTDEPDYEKMAKDLEDAFK